jgi:SecD/SecF fusion protein
MHLKGLVKFFTGALILISLYQLSLTIVVRNEEKKMHAQAMRAAKAEDPTATGPALAKLEDNHYQSITDSMQGENILNMGIKKYTYQAAKQEELSLGLDLQGGMNVTLEVSLDDLVRSMSNNPRDAALNKAINELI